MKNSRAGGRLYSRSKRPRGSGKRRAESTQELEIDLTPSEVPNLEEANVEEAHLKGAQDQVEEDPWAIPIYVAPDLNLPARFTGDEHEFVFRKLFGEGESVSEESSGEDASGEDASGRQRSERIILFNSTRGFRNELIP